MKNKNDIVDILTTTQQKRLKDSIQQAKEGKTISNDKINQNVKKWLANNSSKNQDTRQNPTKNKYD